jgi:hypothetical protein
LQTRICFLLISAALGCGAAFGNTIFSLDPVDGELTVAAGASAGWGFVVDPDAVNWISFTGSALQNLSSPTVGNYLDFIGMTGGPVNAVLPPGMTPWVQSFDDGLGTGAGEFTVSPGAIPGSSETGEIVVFYDEFTDDPNTCASCYLDSLTTAVPFRIDVTAAVPEPGSAGLFLVAALSILAWRKRGSLTARS